MPSLATCRAPTTAPVDSFGLATCPIHRPHAPVRRQLFVYGEETYSPDHVDWEFVKMKCRSTVLMVLTALEVKGSASPL